jgi:hypothetical protein
MNSRIQEVLTMEAENKDKAEKSSSSFVGHWIGHVLAFLAIVVMIFLHIDNKPLTEEEIYAEGQTSHFPKLLSKDTARIDGTATHTIALTIGMEQWKNKFDSARWVNKRLGRKWSPIPALKWYSEAEILDCVVPLSFNLVNVSPDEPANMLFEVAGSVNVDEMFHPYDALISGEWAVQIDTLRRGTQEIVSGNYGEHELNCMLRLKLKNNSSRVYYFAVYENASGQYFYTHSDIICRFDIPLDSLISLKFEQGKPDLTWVLGPPDSTFQSVVPFIQAGSNYYDTIPYSKVARLKLAFEALERKVVRSGVDGDDE